MRILKKSIATLLTICLMFSILPIDMLTHVHANNIIGETSGVVRATGKNSSVGGVLKTDTPVFRVSLSRLSYNYLNGTEEQRNDVINRYKTQYPSIADYSASSLFLWEPNMYNSAISKGYHNGSISIGKYTPGDDGLKWYQSEKHASLNIKLGSQGSLPTNTFKQKLINAYNAKQIGSISDLTNNRWKNYLPTVSEAYAAVNYIFAKTGSGYDVDGRISAFVSPNFKKDPSLFDAAGKFEISAGYSGLLASLYVISAQDANRSALTGNYATALEDYFSSANSEEKPVSLIIDTCMAVVSNGDEAMMVVPSIDFLQYSLLSGTADSITTGSEFIKMMADSAKGNTREMVKAMAQSSLDRLPISQTYAGKGSGIIRLSDAKTTYADQIRTTAFGRIVDIPQFNNAGIRTSKAGVFYHSRGHSGFLDLITFDNNVKGFIIVGQHIANPVPAVSYTVDGTVLVAGDVCDPEITVGSPPKITVNIKGDSSLISSLNSRRDDPNFAGIKIESEIYKTEYLNGFAPSNVVTPKTRMPELENGLNTVLTGESLISTLQGNPIVLTDDSAMGRVYSKVEAGSQGFSYVYDISLTLTIDKEVYEYKKEDIAVKMGTNEYYDFAVVNVPALIFDVPLPEDIVITKPTSTEMKEVINPSENENLTQMTQMIKRYEFTSEGEEFAEIKNNEPLNETYEVMGGVPSSEELYFSVGGSEYKVAMIVQYWMNEHSRDRTYTVHFDGNTCEYNNNEKGKGDTYADFKIPGPEGASSSELNISCTDNEVSATWTVTFTPNCSSTGCHNSSISCSGYDMSQFNTAKAQADAWIAKMGNPSTSTITWTSASDKVERKGFMSGSYSWTPASPNHKSGSCTGCTCSGENPCGSCHSGTAATPCSSQTITYTVKMTIPPHQVCGPCCGHVLPDLYDTWRQGLVFDFAKISQIRLFKLEQGSVDGLKELTGVDTVYASVISGNPTYFMNIAQQTEKDKPILPVGGLVNNIENLEDSGLTYFSGDNRKAAQSSRAGRLRYILDPAYQKSDTISFTEQGNGSGGTFTIDYNKVAAPEQHDDVIYQAGARSKNCDGMATTNNFGKSSSVNVKPMETTGHVNLWADGILYTNILDKTDYSGYWQNGSQYTPKELKENDVNVSKYKEDYNHHVQRDNLKDKIAYSDKADDRDILTPEWNFFNKARRTKIIANVISDFLILQTSGGDQSIIYHEKESVPTEAQEHFQKVKITTDELFKNNPLSIFNGDTTCSGPEIKDENLKDFIVVGGYNGQYNKPTQKYQPYSLLKNEFLPFAGAGKEYDANKHTGTYQYWGGSQVKTIFDTDPAKTINRPKRQATSQSTSFKIIQDDIRILPTSTNKLYGFGEGKVFYHQIAGFYSMDENVRTAGGATRVGCLTNVQIGYEQRLKYGVQYRADWGTHSGVDYTTVYFRTPDGDSTAPSINSVIVYTPVSTEDAMVLPQDNLNVNGKSISRDQRTNPFAFPNMNDLVNKLKVCPLDPELCEYRYLDCKFLHDTVLAEFDFSETYTTQEKVLVNGEYVTQDVVKKNTYQEGGKWITTNKVTGLEYTLPTGFTVQSGSKVGDGRYLAANGTRWSIPFGDLGLSNTKTNRVSVEVDLTVESVANNLMLVSFYNYGFAITPANTVGSFITRSNLDTSKIGGRLDATNSSSLNKVHLSLTFGFNNLVDCSVLVNGVPANVTVSELRNTWVTVGGVRQLQQVQQVIPDITKDTPTNLTIGDIGTNLNIGSWGSSTAYTANYYLDNLKVVLKGGTNEHNSTCYEKITTHATKRIHVHDDKCYLKEDIYTCDGELNANYQLGCGYDKDPGTTVSTFVNFGYSGEIKEVTLNPGTYKIETWGASGGTGSSGYVAGKGAYATSTVTVSTATKYKILVGEMGKNLNTGTGSGGGGTFVATNSNIPISIAGGGGGAYHGHYSGTYYHGQASQVSATASPYITSVSAGQGGFAGYSGFGYPSTAGAGGGFYGNGSANSYSGGGSAGYSFVNGGGSGLGYTSGVHGGFGGGGGTNYVGGGGGGYTGGSAGTGHTSAYHTGFGGGSYYLSGGSSKGGWESMPTPSGGTQVGQTGNGYAKITVVSGSVFVPESVSQTPITYNYTGGIQPVTLQAGKYKIEAWGAQGHDYSTNRGGKGGYSYGEITLTSTTTLYLAVGGQGTASSGGYNGGAAASTQGGGGGATHISTATGLLNSLSGNKTAILMVAGGGGGSYCSNTGGAGGGGNNNGTNGTSPTGSYGWGGSSTYSAYFGQGSSGYRHGGGGGGGYYAGYGGYDCNGGGGGGSGHINTAKLTNYGGTNGTQSGNGKVVITPMGHVHLGTPGLDYANGCYTKATVHKHNNTVKVLNCTIPVGGDGKVYNFAYKGNVQQVTLPAGRYKLETWGAQGGHTEGGKGGYSKGTVNLAKGATLYIVVGGQGGASGSTTNGGYNGGGYSVAYGTGGGGATHIATRTGVLTSLNSYRSDILLVAGGGGGYAGASGRYGGAGGGLTGSNGYNGCGGMGYGGTQTAGGTTGRNGTAAGFGFGGSQTAGSGNGGAGGGGGFYGGGAGGNDYSSYRDNDDSGGGGGSGYIGGVSNGSMSSGVQSGNGRAVITNLDHQHNDSCYTTTTSSCPVMPKGSLVCTGELNTLTDYNAHIHTVDCLKNYTNLDAKTFLHSGSVQTYVVPYTDFYTIEAYGSSANNKTGYTKGKVKLKQGTILYIYVGSQAGYNSGVTDVRLKAVPTGTPATGEEALWESILQESNNTRMFIAGKTLATSSINNVNNLTVTNQEKTTKGSSSNGRVVITPANTNASPTILEQIVSGSMSSENARKYLGNELYEAITSNPQVLHTWSGWTTANDKGFKAIKDCSLTMNGNLVVNSKGIDPIVRVAVDNIPAKTISQIKVYLNNSPSNQGQIFFTDATGYENEIDSVRSNIITPNASNQVMTFDVASNKNLSGNITSIRFDFMTAAGTATVTKIELIGFGSKTAGTGEASYVNNEVIVATAGTVWDYNYMGNIQTKTLEKGTYKLETWGAQGGTNGGVGGLGGYSVGTIELNNTTTLYIGVGGQGSALTGTGYIAGGFNGGGGLNLGSHSGNGAASGGGATHIATANGILANLSGNKTSVLLVSGGGGGGTSGNSGSQSGGFGGGLTGGAGAVNGYAVAYGGTQTAGGAISQSTSYSSGSTAGTFGLGGTTYGASNTWYGGAGGGGYYGGGPNTVHGGGGGGSGYIGGVSNGSMSTGVQSGNGKAKITAVTDIKTGSITYSFTPLKLTYVSPFQNNEQIIINNLDKIPDKVDGDYNPIWLCKFVGYNTHVCETVNANGEVVNLCKTTTVFNCSEPHHRGEHYSGSNKICWSACEDDSKHVNTKTETVVNQETGETVHLAEFLQLDAGFTVYFPNRGNFYGNNALGLASPQVTRGKGYTQNMDTTQWTREKRVRFPFDVIFENEVHFAGTWIELDVPTEYFNFYLLVSNSELANAQVEFEVEAINCGTSSGVDVTPNISYADMVSTEYSKTLDKFRLDFLKTLLTHIRNGYLVPIAQAGGNNNVTNALDFGKSGYEAFYIEKQNVNDKTLRDAISKINKQIESDFEGNSANGTINPHTNSTSGINKALKSITSNDNMIRVDNKMRANSLESLHGGYKSFYLDVVGRVGNFAIVDTEDFRFSNFFKMPIIDASDSNGLADANNWLVEGLVLKVDDSIQNLYIGDLFDIRGNKASSETRWLDTYGTETWMSGQLGESGRDVNNPNLVAQVLSRDTNNVEVLRNEELRFGYDAYTSLVTMGSYQSGNIQVIPKYYALKITDVDMTKEIPDIPSKYNVAKGTYIPLDVYINKDGLYSPVNVYGNAGNGIKNKGKLDMYDYVFNLDWTDESNRRNYTLDEKARTLQVAEFLKTVIYDVPEGTTLIEGNNLAVKEVIELVTPKGKNNLLGTSQYILMNSNHRTFIGDINSYGGNVYKSKAGNTDFGINKNKNDAVDPLEFYKGVQRWHGKLGVPSSSVFVPTGVQVNTDTVKYIMNDNFAIICTAETIAIGDVWTLYYSQPWFDKLSINGEDYQTAKHYPGHRVIDSNGNSVECPDCIPPIVAVYSSNKSSVDDVEIVNTH